MPDYKPGLYFVRDKDGTVAIERKGLGQSSEWYVFGLSWGAPFSGGEVLSGPHTADELLSLVQDA